MYLHVQPTAKSSACRDLYIHTTMTVYIDRERMIENVPNSNCNLNFSLFVLDNVHKAEKKKLQQDFNI